MKKLLSILLVILMLCSCTAEPEQPINFEPYAKVQSPPDVAVQYGEVSVNATKGTYSWEYEENGKYVCIEADSDHPTAFENIASFSAGDDETAKLIFDENMITYELYRWRVGKDYLSDGIGADFEIGPEEKVPSENGVFEVPDDGNIYVYELYVKYKSGSCHYGFRIDSRDEWGITLSVKDVTATGATIVFSQSGGNPTGELDTGSYYRLEHENENMAFIVEGEVVWTAEAYMIRKDGKTEMKVNWEWLYGTLEPGTYRIVKQVMDFRGPGDFDEKEYSAEFTIGGKDIKSLSIMKIVDGAESGNLVLASETEGVMTLSTENIPVFLDGKEADPSSIMDGMTVHIHHSGNILETYPAKFENVSKIEVFSIGTKNQVGGTLFDLCGLYLKVLDDLWKVDSGLNGDAEYVSIDLSEAPGGLNEFEKAAIRWIFENKHGVMVLGFTLEELKEQGYLTAAGGSDDLYQWDNGVLLSITQKQSEEPDAYYGLRTIKFNAMKWRSPLGAYMFMDCTASWPQMGTWEDYNIGSEAIS